MAEDCTLLPLEGPEEHPETLYAPNPKTLERFRGFDLEQDRSLYELIGGIEEGESCIRCGKPLLWRDVLKALRRYVGPDSQPLWVESLWNA